MNRFWRVVDALSREERADPSLNFNQWVDMFSFGGTGYPFSVNQSIVGNKESVPHSFATYCQTAYKSNGVVFACQLARLMLFSEARFQFQQIRQGRPGKLFGTPALDILETPWTGATTGDLLARAIQDADLAGNFYGVVHEGQVKRLRPDWVSILLGSMNADPLSQPSPGDIDAEVIAYLYTPGGLEGKQKTQTLMVEDVIHYAPIPDPLATFRGMSWLTPIMREILSDSGFTSHKLAFLENGATPNAVVSLDPAITKLQFDEWIKSFQREHEGLANAYKTMYLGGGAKMDVVGSDLKQMDFKTVQGAGETRIAAAAGVPPIIVGLSEGLESATYSNYGQARRRFADGTMRPLWRNFAGSLERVISVPPGSRLWYDDRDIPFLQEDRADAANILHVKSQSIQALVMAGYDPDTVVEAIEADDLSQLSHSGLYSVQLRPPNSADPTVIPGTSTPAALPAPISHPKLAAPAPNGKGKQASARLLTEWIGDPDG